MNVPTYILASGLDRIRTSPKGRAKDFERVIYEGRKFMSRQPKTGDKEEDGVTG
jgi:hypothetical protein